MTKKIKNSGKTKIPKRVAGVKIPKELRRKGDALLETMASPQGREMIGTGVTMAAMGLMAAVQTHRARDAGTGMPPIPPVPPVPPVPPIGMKPAAATRAGQPGIGDPHMLGDALGNLAETIVDRVFGQRKSG